MADRKDVMHKDYPPFIKVKSGSKVDVHYSVLHKGIPEELRIRYEDEVKETPENRKQGLCRLKEFIKLEELDNLEDTLLLAVLRASKFNMKKAEAKLRSFIKYRRELVDRLADIDMETIENVLFEDVAIGMLPYRDSGGATIIYTNPCGASLDKYNFEDAVVCGFCMLLFFLTCELTTFAGISYIADCKTPSLPLLVQIVNGFRHYMSHILSYPLRVKKADCVNEIALLRWLVKLLRPLVPEKIYKRLSFNGDGYDNLQKTYHPDILPEEFGGNLGPLNNKFYRQQVLDYFVQLKAESLQRTARKSST